MLLYYDGGNIEDGDNYNEHVYCVCDYNIHDGEDDYCINCFCPMVVEFNIVMTRMVIIVRSKMPWITITMRCS